MDFLKRVGRYRPIYNGVTQLKIQASFLYQNVAFLPEIWIIIFKIGGWKISAIKLISRRFVPPKKVEKYCEKFSHFSAYLGPQKTIILYREGKNVYIIIRVTLSSHRANTLTFFCRHPAFAVRDIKKSRRLTFGGRPTWANSLFRIKMTVVETRAPGHPDGICVCGCS